MNTLLAQMPSHRYRYGLVYSDPIKDPIPVDTFNQVARHFPRVDLLAYVAANDHYKRANANGYGHGRALPEDIAAVNKKIALIREPHTAHQWTFILWSDWTKLPEWRKRGFHRIDEGAGRRILRRVALTKAELHEQENTPLPLDNGLPYRSYREYLRHPRFLKVRTEVFDRAGGKCERCGIRPPTEPHHLRYPPWGTFDVPENLVAICHQCHCDAHGKAS
ncbi:MAG: HNH endonuclease [Nocardioidaceae bacterium]